MKRIRATAELRGQIRQWRLAEERIALVPTMGNLHAGHLTLVRRARELAPRVVASIFVNPMQFGAGEDYAGYPRTLEADAEALAAEGADLLFAPATETIYPAAIDRHTRVEVPGLSDELCGAYRPGHFAGVATVVCKLFNLVQPDVAVFGEKDLQQLEVIRRMTVDLALPVEVVGAPTVRDPDGLALSSRNAYLTAEERARAPALYRVLQEVSEALKGGDRRFSMLEREACERLEREGFEPDYVAIRRAAGLGAPVAGDPELAVLAAARLGKARLIDNLRVPLNPTR